MSLHLEVFSFFTSFWGSSASVHRKHSQTEHNNPEENLSFSSKIFDIAATFKRQYFLCSFQGSCKLSRMYLPLLVLRTSLKLLVIKSCSLFLFKTILTSLLIGSMIFEMVLLCLCIDVKNILGACNSAGVRNAQGCSFTTTGLSGKWTGPVFPSNMVMQG